MHSKKWASQKPVRRWDFRPSHSDDGAAGSEDDGSADSEDDVETRAKTDPALAGEMFVEFALTLYFEGKLSAKSLCCLCWWAEQAGAKQEPISKFALSPSASSGHFQRKVDVALDLTTKCDGMLTIPVPGHTKHDMFRTVEHIPVLPPHEVVEKELVQDPDLLDKIEQMSERDDWTRAYKEHAVVNSSDEPVVPLLLYVDGVPFLKRDSVIGFYIHVLLTGRRYLMSILRKSYMCKCGCRGWCSLVQIWAMLRWSLESCRLGFWPDVKYNGDSFTEADGDHFKNKGKRLSAKSALIHIKGDWAEFAHSFGFPTWCSNTNPCMFCKCNKKTLYRTQFSPFGMPHEDITQTDYDAACCLCEVWILITTVAMHCAILGALRYDKRKEACGRALQRDLPEYGLEVYDRLEPQPGMYDVADFDRLVLPRRVLFWRRRNDTIARHRCPVFSSLLGVSVGTLELDVLHILNLGVYLWFITDAVWHLIRVDAWKMGTEFSQDERHQLSAQRLKVDLMAWYERMHRERPTMHLHKLQELSPEMLGEWNNPKMRLKAAESKTMLYFVTDLLGEHAGSVPDGEALFEAGSCLVRFQDLMDLNDQVLPTTVVQDRFLKKTRCCV